MIKKILVSLFLLAITQLILSQNLTSLVTKYADKDSVKHQVIDKVMLALARLTTASKLGNSDLFDKLDQIDILDVAKTSQ